MPITVRVLFFMGALALGLLVFYLGASTSYALEPEEFGIRAKLFWLTCSVLVCLPLWLPALLPVSSCCISTFCRWVCALLLLVPAYFCGTIVIHNLSGGWLVLRTEPGPLLIGVGLTSICVAGSAILAWVNLRGRGESGAP